MKRFLWVCLFIAILLLVSALLAWVFEHRGYEGSSIKSFWDGIWWSIVTIATVGYGDKYPITFPGRLVGITLIVVGYASLSFFTGLIASLFVEDKLKGAKGLKQIHAHDHVVICGWNNSGDFLLKALLEKNLQSVQICIIANETPEFFERLEARFPALSLSFVRGEGTQEEILLRASVPTAAKVIILADQQLDRSAADDRSIIIANAVHFMAKKDKITVQLLNTENRSMLQRLGISNILVWDDIGGYLLANSISDINCLSAYYQLVKDNESRLCSMKISDSFVGRSYGELFDHLYKEGGRLLLGLLCKEPELEMQAIFTADSSGIDQFIQYALSRSQKSFAEDKSNIRWNPPRDSAIQSNDHAIFLA